MLDSGYRVSAAIVMVPTATTAITMVMMMPSIPAAGVSTAAVAATGAAAGGAAAGASSGGSVAAGQELGCGIDGAICTGAKAVVAGDRRDGDSSQ